MAMGSEGISGPSGNPQQDSPQYNVACREGASRHTPREVIGRIVEIFRPVPEFSATPAVGVRRRSTYDEVGIARNGAKAAYN